MAITLPITSRTSSDDNDFADVYANDAQLVTELDDRDGNYQTIFVAGATISLDKAAGTYQVGSGFDFFYFDDADFATSSKTQKLRIRAALGNNGTAWSSVTATVGLYPITFSGGSDTITVTLGTVVSGSTVALANPTANALTQGNSGDFTIPSDGAYCLGYVMSATQTNNAASVLSAQVQTRWV